jgi:hypothetical protein
MKAVVTGSAIGRSSSGKLQLWISFRTLEAGATDAGDDVAAGSAVAYYQPLETERGPEFAAKALKVLGWDPDVRGWRLEELHDTSTIVGREADLVVEDSEYGGRVTRRVRFVNAVGGGGGLRHKAETADVAAFGAMLRARIGGAPAAARIEEAPF